MCLAVGCLVVVGEGHGWAAAAPSAQAVRTCVDRWNQNNMVSWGSMSVSIAIRALDARERVVLSLPDRRPRRPEARRAAEGKACDAAPPLAATLSTRGRVHLALDAIR